MGWISDRKMRTGRGIGGSAGPNRGSRKGPLREIVARKRWGEGMFDTDWVVLSCGHEGPATIGAQRARCAKCRKEAEGRQEARATHPVDLMDDIRAFLAPREPNPLR